MQATAVYVSVAQLVFKLGFEDNFTETITALNKKLPELRQLVACAVCRDLLNDPYLRNNRCCEHNVCRQCIKGKKVLKPPCPNCNESNDFKTYDENRQMNKLIQCYKSLCEYIVTSYIYPHLGTSPIKYENDELPQIRLWNMSCQAIVLEGAQTDEFSAFSSDISSNSTTAALEEASNSARFRLNQYKRVRDPDADVEDEESNLEPANENENLYENNVGLEPEPTLAPESNMTLYQAPDIYENSLDGTNPYGIYMETADDPIDADYMNSLFLNDDEQDENCIPADHLTDFYDEMNGLDLPMNPFASQYEDSFSTASN